jgi:ABC-type transporter Mla subunit MlaD
MQNLKASMAHLNEATTALAESSKKLDDVIGKAGATMDSAKDAADNLQDTILEARKVFQTATQGKGLLATLLVNQQLSEDLRALIANLRAHGVLFYRDTAAKMQANPQKTPSRQTGARP